MAKRTASTVDAAALAAALRKAIRGEVRFDDGSRALYATDASNYRQVPIGVVLPYDADDVIATVAIARSFGAPILARGGGTSLAGQCCNVAVVLDMSKFMRRLLELDRNRRIARVEPGIVLDELRDAAEELSLTFAPDPATHNRCTIGGMIGNNSCGVHSVMGGKTDDNIEELDILTYDGLRMRVGATSDDELDAIIRGGGRRAQIYEGLRGIRDRFAGAIRERYPDIPRRVSGYNLDQLLPEKGFHVARALVGTEGTCVVVLEAVTRLVPSPPRRTLVVLGFEEVYTAADHVPQILEFGPIGLEGFDQGLIDDMRRKNLHIENLKLLPEGGGWLLVEFGGATLEESNEKARRLVDAMRSHPAAPSAAIFDDPLEAKKIWQVRESGLGATAISSGRRPTWEGWEDSAVPPAKLGSYLRELRTLLDEFGYRGDLYGHFGDGCVHTRNDFDLESHEGIAKYRTYVERASDLVLRYGGSLSGEHGDGQSRGELLEKMFGEELVGAFREFKRLWDPEWKMNPGKVVDAYRLDENLRLGADFEPWQPETHFRFPDDDRGLLGATMRCVGVGLCRRTEGGTMCPSYMVTREEMHSTRGRAHLLFEMMHGEPFEHDWRNEHVKEALDLCLACKGCLGDCPVDVDVATYKAEFLSHYYAGRLRPMGAYSMGLIQWWARLASRVPRLANATVRAPIIASAIRGLTGISRQREMPRFASQTFKAWFARRPLHGTRSERKVLLWPDTFNNHFRPETAKAAVDILEDAGFAVIVPKPWLCCGRPLYDFGMLDLARWHLRRILRELEPYILDGVPLVGLEPSCIATFRDELINLFPEDRVARRLSEQSFLLSELLARQATHWTPPAVARKAVVHGHCHHKAVMGFGDEKSVLESLGLDLEILDSGCCGMAGSFGFAEKHYDISVKCGERVLLPAVREAAADTLIIADGFSCREQIEQLTGRRTHHLVEVIRNKWMDIPMSSP
ncbi:MAG TPA: FAD-linked oxidase C-terminal domain-containing protein [Thermoanaerobaculia bacterium]|nr:FAD-linked oxidase C-terminal domain-containing protein [Thermoanaerobaculia bacterium]